MTSEMLSEGSVEAPQHYSVANAWASASDQNMESPSAPAEPNAQAAEPAPTAQALAGAEATSSADAANAAVASPPAAAGQEDAAATPAALTDNAMAMSEATAAGAPSPAGPTAAELARQQYEQDYAEYETRLREYEAEKGYWDLENNKVMQLNSALEGGLEPSYVAFQVANFQSRQSQQWKWLPHLRNMPHGPEHGSGREQSRETGLDRRNLKEEHWFAQRKIVSKATEKEGKLQSADPFPAPLNVRRNNECVTAVCLRMKLLVDSFFRRSRPQLFVCQPHMCDRT